MPPQFSRLTSDGSAAVVRRTSSVGQNCDMYTIRLQINQAFQEADKDGSGHLSKQELLKVLESLNITLQNPIDDMDVIFDTLDANHSGHIDLDEWGACFEPAVSSVVLAPRFCCFCYEFPHVVTSLSDQTICHRSRCKDGHGGSDESYLRGDS